MRLKLQAREFTSPVQDTSGGTLMFAPAGDHTILPAAGEGSAEVTIRVDETTTQVLNASLAEINARIAPQRCFIDKEHEGKEATAWPQSFFWSETPAPGVYARVEFSALGKELVQGKVLRAFSPSFYSDAALPKRIAARQHVKVAAGSRGSASNPARIVSLVPPDIGTLTNNPAFKKILPLWAKNAAGARSSKNQKTNMKLTDQELAALRARKTELEQAIIVLRAKDQEDAATAEALATQESDLTSVTARLQAHEMAARNEALETALRAQREKDADGAIRAAVKRGALPAKDETLQQQWRQRLIEDPGNLALLQAMNGSPALQQSRIILQGGGAQVTRESTGSVLRAYLQATEGKDHKQASALYAREIRPRLKEGDDMPLRAADVTDGNLGTLAGTLVAQRTLELFRLQFDGLLSLIATDFSDQASDFGGTTMTRIVVVPAVESYHTTNGWIQGTPAQTVDVPITLDQHRGVPIAFNSNMLASTARRLFDEQAPAAAYALAKDVIDHLYTRITAGNFASPAPFAEAEIDFGRRTFGKVGRVFNPAGVPMENRFALLNSDFHDALEQDPTLTNLAVTQASREGIITAGRVPPIKKFQPIEAPNLPATGNLAAFFGHKSALLVKSRVPNDYTSVLPGGAAHGLIRLVTDPDTGLTVMVVWYADHQKGTGNFRIACMYGTAAGNTGGGQIVTSA